MQKEIKHAFDQINEGAMMAFIDSPFDQFNIGHLFILIVGIICAAYFIYRVNRKRS